MTTRDSDAQRLWRSVRDAMLMGDTPLLSDLLLPDFTLTHMTGYVQRRDEWLTAMDDGDMTYHSVEDVEAMTSATASGDQTYTVRTMTDASIWGGRGTWRLQLILHLAHADDDSAGPPGHLRSMVASVW
jgi:hypothetical protein